MIALTLPQPYGIKFADWGAVAAEQLAAYGVSAPPSEDDWKSWVCALFYVPELSDIPSPDQFPTWQAWAYRFIETR